MPPSKNILVTKFVAISILVNLVIEDCPVEGKTYESIYDGSYLDPCALKAQNFALRRPPSIQYNKCSLNFRTRN